MLQTRRQFLANATVVSCGAVLVPGCVGPAPQVSSGGPVQPWYRRTLRWGQTNITEADPATYDIPWWRNYWKRTLTQGIIVNAGGIVAYYPSREALQFRPASLGQRDLFGELVNAARAEGLVVLARMDSSRAHEDLYNAHPSWFAVDAAGRPHRAGDLFVTCVNSPYYEEYLPRILREVAEAYRPEGFADNSWSGLGRDQICYCDNCRKRFEENSDQSLPARKNWDDPVYRKWILWNYERRVQLWDANNQVTRAAGGPDCLWIGMNSGSISGQCQNFRDYKAICARAELILLDHQARGEDGDFSQNADAGQLLHQLLGWDKLIPESMAMYQAGRPTFRKSSKPRLEAQLWMLEGMAGGLQPWWHHVGAQQEDQRQFQIAEPVYRWHAAHQEFLINRRPLATVGLVWSQRNTDFFGRDHPNELVDSPWRGWTQALMRARIPYLPVQVDDLERHSSNLALLILPNLGALSDNQVESVRQFVRRGGSLIATGRTSLYDEWGQPRADFALADILGGHYVALGRENERPRELLGETHHSYLRIEAGSPSHALNLRSELLAGFEATNILPFGGWLGDVIAAPGAHVPLTYIPPFPIYPPETSWMREARTHVPGLILNSDLPAGKVAFLTADIDRRFAVEGLPDHGQLLSNLVRWAAQGRSPVTVEGPGLIDVRLYSQGHRLILHLVNLTGVSAPHGPIEELVSVGPIRVRLELASFPGSKRVRFLVSAERPRAQFERQAVLVTLPSLSSHEVIVVG
ncbi:MAG TPA: beta-galactosidase [Verrucomicrobiae bacterium]|nr:beta-galactosidase [Verrucomicrobiae bacterium]